MRKFCANANLLQQLVYGGCNEVYISASRMWELKDIGKLLYLQRQGGKEKCTVGEAEQAERRRKSWVWVAELGARKEKYKAMENEGKKPTATRKTFAWLKEEEKKEATRLQKLLTDVWCWRRRLPM